MAAFQRTYGQLALFFAMFAILFQALLPMAQGIPWERTGEDLPDVLIVCSSWGARTITIDARRDTPAPPQRGGETGDASAACPICTIHFMKIRAPGDDAVVLHAPIGQTATRLPPEAPAILAAETTREQVIRAPPGTVS